MKNYAVLIPSKARPDALVTMFKRNPQLNTPDTFVGIETREASAYKLWKSLYGSNVTVVLLDNPKGFASNAREALRLASHRKYRRYLLTDDNAVFSPKSFNALLKAQELEGCVVSGLGVPELWHKDAIDAGKVHILPDGQTLHTFKSYSTVHWVIPNSLYSEFRYPANCSNDDVYFMLWAMLHKRYTEFKGCLEAKYSKKRFVPGGHGSSSDRLYKMAVSMAMLATDFPEVASHEWMLTRFPFQKIATQISNKET